MSGGPEETPPARLLRDLSCVALCPAACWFRRGYLNRGPKSRLICHSAGRTGQLHRAAIWSSALCCSAPGCPAETQTSCLEREQERKERRKKETGEKFGGNVGHWGSYAANAFARLRVVRNNSCFPRHYHIFCRKSRQKSCESRHACRNLRAAVGRLKMGPIRSLRNCCEKLILSEEDKQNAKTYIE